MKPEHLQDALNEIKEEYIADAHAGDETTEASADSPSVRPDREPVKGLKTIFRRPVFRIALAACLVLFIGGGAILAVITRATTHYPPSSGRTEGVYIPPAEIPEPSATADMMGLICHNGKVYLNSWGNSYTFPLDENSDSLSYEELKSLFPSLGTYLGEAVCDIDEWNWDGPEGVVDLASTQFGSVYTTSEYDEDFRLCIVGKWYPEEGGVRYYINYFECLTGITLVKGSNLLEDRLHLSRFLPAAPDENTQTLLSAMNEAPFVYVESRKNHNVYSGVPLLDGEPDFRYVKYGSAYLELFPTDNVPISFKVYKNGYIQYNLFGMHEYYMTVDPALVEYLFP